MGHSRNNKASKEKLRLYKLSLITNNTDEIHQKYVSYRNKYNKLKHVNHIELLQLKMYTL